MENRRHSSGHCHLQSVATCHHDGGIAEAIATLHVGQPAVTRQLRVLDNFRYRTLWIARTCSNLNNAVSRAYIQLLREELRTSPPGGILMLRFTSTFNLYFTTPGLSTVTALHVYTIQTINPTQAPGVKQFSSLITSFVNCRLKP